MFLISDDQPSKPKMSLASWIARPPLRYDCFPAGPALYEMYSGPKGFLSVSLKRSRSSAVKGFIIWGEKNKKTVAQRTRFQRDRVSSQLSGHINELGMQASILLKQVLSIMSQANNAFPDDPLLKRRKSDSNLLNTSLDRAQQQHRKRNSQMAHQLNKSISITMAERQLAQGAARRENDNPQEDTFYRALEIKFHHSVGSMSISPACRDVVLAG